MRITIKFPNISNDIMDVVNTYNEAKSLNELETINILTNMMESHLEAGNKFWSFLNLELDKSTLEIEEFTQTSMKDISDIVEGISKSHFIEQVLINRVLRKKPAIINEVINFKLGNLIHELISTSKYPHLFTTKPDNIKLSDWRNIASHHSYSVQGEIITCEYGEQFKKSFTISRDELFNRIEQCSRTMEVMSMAHKFFGFDNMQAIRARMQPKTKYYRKEPEVMIFTSALASQGFEILKLDFAEKDFALLELIDLTDDDPLKRGIHSSQLLMPLWNLTEKNRLEVRYYMKNKTLFLTSKCTSDICELIASGDKKLSYLAEKVEFTRY